jgi:uncharacterized membrane-anchored protein
LTVGVVFPEEGMMRMTRGVGLLALLTLAPLAAAAAGAQDEAAGAAEVQALASRLKYQTGKIRLRDGLATISLSDAFRYLDPAGADTLLTGIWGNPPSQAKSLGVITPAGFDPFGEDSWCVVVSYDEDGYVKDDDAASIDYTELLKEMQEGTREASKQRVKDGYPAIELVGWAARPSYDRQSHKFFWAKELKFSGSEGNTLNYNLRILGRGGVLVLNVVAGMAQLEQVQASVPAILAMVDFEPGQRYADYKPGTDKVASYGLAALVAGGVAAKSGLLKTALAALFAMKKFVVIGLVALVALLRKIFAARTQES